MPVAEASERRGEHAKPGAGSVPSLALITAALMLMMVLASMEQTVTVTALPTIIGELRGLQYYAWVQATYLLAATVVMPLYGRLADVLGRKRVIMAAVTLFVIGSILSSFAHSMQQLIGFRIIQGLGAGGIMPVVLTILGDIFTIQQRARVQGCFSAVWGTSALAGPWLGAYLVKYLGWRSIFWVNWPFGLLGLAVLAFVYHDREKPHSTELDLMGIGALATGAGGLLLFLSLLGQPDAAAKVLYAICPRSVESLVSQLAAAWIVLAGLGLVTVVAGVFFYYHEQRTKNPVLPPALFFQRAIGPALVCSLLLGLCFISVETWVPLYVQGGGRAERPTMRPGL